ncbi:MAG: hypothetical protein IKT08_08520 [Bacteroidales bacterium]|nr:hypothetical protein [Bacteroidales bacterium]
MMKFYIEEDFTEENIKKAWNEIDELCEKAEKRSKLLKKAKTPEFKSIEEAEKYYNAIPLEEFEREVMEKYGI